ncbi:MAG: GxGYxYP domain-containing protein, partial [Armatimonadota bacterium]
AAGKVIERQTDFYIYAPEIMEKSTIYHLDLSQYRRIDATNKKLCEEAYDTLHLIAVLQGIVNREKPQLYINYNDVDQFWLDFMRTPDGYLANADIVKISTPMEAVEIFKDYINGLVVWDESVPATSYIATTVCGVEDLLPVRYDESEDSIYSKLVNGDINFEVKHNFVGMFTGNGMIPGTDRPSTKSAKNDAYIWAKINYLDTGKCSGTEIGYWCDAYWLKHAEDLSIDNVGLTNQDYIVSKRGFMVDLHVRADETPRDDPNQELGTDLNTLKEILEACYKLAGDKMIHFSGFTPWAIKYTSHGNAGGKHHPVTIEWETAKIVSAYNAYLDADAIGLVSMANASLFNHYKLPDRFIQNNKPTFEDLQSKGYIDSEGNIADRNFLYHYVGDYDAAAWMYNVMPGMWADPMRGKVPAGHAFNPNLIERFPLIFQWVFESKSANDYFIAGDSGAGYVNPTQLIEPRRISQLPSGADIWIEHNKKYYRKLNYSITGFLLNGASGMLNDEAISMYKSFSGDGVLTHTHWLPADKKFDHMLKWMPVGATYGDLKQPDEDGLAQLTAHAKRDEPGFLSIRTVLWTMQSYSRVNNFIQQSRPDLKFEPVEPFTYMYLLRHHLGGKNECRATFTFDTLPDEAAADSELTFTLGIRNDGWEEWQKDGQNAVSVWCSFEGEKPILVPIKHNVSSGEGIVIEISLPTPHTVGDMKLTIDLHKNGIGTYSEQGNLCWEHKINIR